ncbi:TonB-dependent receptor domain-containing protein [Chitinophagaceae bacterium MMS25-I14]
MKGFIATAILILIYTDGFTQATGNGKITGTVTDAVSKQPVEYATITVADEQTGKVINGASSDTKGIFAVTSLPDGTYRVVVDFIGYEKDTISNIVLNSSRKEVPLGNIFISPSRQTLKGAVITAKTPVIENKIDKIIFNTANDITSQGGVALDVLKKVPQVTVDVDGNVELQGNANIRFLINGKPSSVFGNSVADALAAIPASQIKSIEVITSPGAKYDAEGTGGIINIILKDNKAKGINGNVNLSAGTRLQNGSANLNIRHGNFGVNAYLSGNAQLNSRNTTIQNRLSADTTAHTTTRLLQDGYSDFQRTGYQGGIGFDWDITPKNNLTGSLSYNHFGNHNEGSTNQEQLTDNALNNPVSDLYTTRTSDNRFHNNSVDWSLNYKKKFRQEDRELNILYSSSFGKNYTDYTQSQVYSGTTIPFSGSSSNNPGTDRETNISVDYTQPISKKLTLETGAKLVLRNIHSAAAVNTLDPSSNEYAADVSQSYNLSYNRQIYAGYISGTFSLFNFLDVKAGARLEHTNTTIDFPGTSIPSYNTFVPSVVFSHAITKSQTIKISYSHRIERPDYRELNPFINLSDPYNITTGNPALKPEIGDNAELGYNRTFEKGGNIYVALIYRHNSDDIKPYTDFYSSYKVGDSVYNNVSVNTRRNIGEEVRAGISISGSMPVKDKLNLRTNIFVSDRYIMNQYAGGNTTSGLDYRINLNASYQVGKDFITELFGNYNSSINNVQGKTPQFFSYTLALRKQFANKKASIGVTATNIFSQYVKQVTTITDANYTSYSVREVPYRSFGVSFTYKFGKLEFKKGKNDDNNYGIAPADQQ